MIAFCVDCLAIASGARPGAAYLMSDRRDSLETQISTGVTSHGCYFNRCPSALTTARAFLRQKVFQHADRRRQPGVVPYHLSPSRHLLLLHTGCTLLQPYA